MSSQGPSTGTSTGTGATGCYGNTQSSQVAAGYPFDKDAIRDGSDWIAYKKQTLILNESKTKLKAAHPEISYGNNYRIQYLLGRYKNAYNTACNNCSTNELLTGAVPNPS